MSDSVPPVAASGNNTNTSSTVKRKRTPSTAASPSSAPPTKAPKTSTTTITTNTTTAGAAINATNTTNVGNPGHQLQINYLARQCAADLPFITKDDTLPNILDILGSYTQVLDRQESLASNLGARPLGPILIKRFERCFDAPPQIIASHSHAKGASASDDEASASPTVTWLDVVHFAQAHPAQFTLSTFSEGRRVCQFYYPQKQVRVQVSEEDFLFINSGRCRDLIPPLPICEDEEKEVGTCEILEKALRDLTNAADLVAARTRQLGHRLKGRRMAIQERRSEQGHAHVDPDAQTHSPSSASVPPRVISSNAQPMASDSVRASLSADTPDSAAAMRTDLLRHFQSLPHNQTPVRPDSRRASIMRPHSPAPAVMQNYTPQPSHSAMPADMGQSLSGSVSPAPTALNPHALDPLSYYIDNTPSSARPSFTPANLSNTDPPKHNFSRPLPPSQESSQPYRAICQAHMESLPRGSRVLPPCDRCRRLRMDCLKNLSSCGGCTKKHARCHWKDVRREEVQCLDAFEEPDAAERQPEPHHAINMSADSDGLRHLGSEGHGPEHGSENNSHNDELRRLSEEGLASTQDNSSAVLPPLRHYEPESSTSSVNQPPMSAMYPTQHSLPHEQHHGQAARQEPDSTLGGSTSLPNPFAKRTEGDDDNNNHAFDLLRLLGRDAANPGAQGVGNAAPGTRNNGAFRSVYSSHDSEAGPTETTQPNTSASLVGLANLAGLAGLAGGDGA